jgi:hypothetical protein
MLSISFFSFTSSAPHRFGVAAWARPSWVGLGRFFALQLELEREVPDHGRFEVGVLLRLRAFGRRGRQEVFEEGRVLEVLEEVRHLLEQRAARVALGLERSGRLGLGIGVLDDGHVVEPHQVALAVAAGVHDRDELVDLLGPQDARLGDLGQRLLATGEAMLLAVERLVVLDLRRHAVHLGLQHGPLALDLVGHAEGEPAVPGEQESVGCGDTGQDREHLDRCARLAPVFLGEKVDLDHAARTREARPSATTKDGAQASSSSMSTRSSAMRRPSSGFQVRAVRPVACST